MDNDCNTGRTKEDTCACSTLEKYQSQCEPIPYTFLYSIMNLYIQINKDMRSIMLTPTPLLTFLAYVMNLLYLSVRSSLVEVAAMRMKGSVVLSGAF